MNRLVIPLQGRTVFLTGDTVVWAELELSLRNGAGLWQTEPFRFDTGAEMSTMPAWYAKQLALPMPIRPSPGHLTNLPGVPIRSGFVRAKVVGLGPTAFVFPCYFLGDPDVAPARPAGHFLHNLLGLTGVVNQLRFGFDGTSTPTLAAPFGVLTVEEP